MTGWGDNGVAEFSNYNGGAAQTLCAAVAPATTTMTEEESPPRTCETEVTANCYQANGLVYLRDPQAGHLLASGPPREAYDTGGGSGLRRTRSDSVSDSEAHISPGKCSIYINFFLLLKYLHIHEQTRKCLPRVLKASSSLFPSWVFQVSKDGATLSSTQVAPSSD